jgi:hypothetical protein
VWWVWVLLTPEKGQISVARFLHYIQIVTASMIQTTLDIDVMRKALATFEKKPNKNAY